MTAEPVPTRWRFRLQLLAGLALLILLLMVLRGRARHSATTRARETLVATLRQLVAVQEEHYARHGRYATAVDGLTEWRPLPTVTLVLEADDDQNWRATVTDSSIAVPPRTCGVFLGRPATAPHRAVLQPGEPVCW